jgi:hypothetical protein
MGAPKSSAQYAGHWTLGRYMPSRACYAEEVISGYGTEAMVREFAHHVLIFSQATTQELISSPEILDVRDVATSPAVFYQTVSDHLPIRARFRSGPDDD